jgi:hypothetical protein
VEDSDDLAARALLEQLLTSSPPRVVAAEQLPRLTTAPSDVESAPPFSESDSESYSSVVADSLARVPESSAVTEHLP